MEVRSGFWCDHLIFGRGILTSPIGKQFFLAVAACAFVGLLIYGEEIKSEKATCAAQKVQFLKQLHSDYVFTPRKKPFTFNPFWWLK